MQRSRYYIYYLLGILFLLVSCREEEIIGEGTLRLKVTMDGDVTTSTVTRSTESLTDKLNENCQVQSVIPKVDCCAIIKSWTKCPKHYNSFQAVIRWK